MKYTLSIFLLVLFLLSCSNEDACSDGIQNQDETDIDCGGICGPCPNCTNGVQDFEEAGVDCGGNCTPCPDNWEVIEYGSGRLEHISFINEEVGFVLNNLFTTYQLRRTFDGGQSWETFEVPLSGINTGNQSVLEFGFLTENKGYALEKVDNGVSDHRLFITINGGRSWEPVFEVENAAIFDVEFVSSTVGYLVRSFFSSNSNAHVYKTTDGGLNWEKIYESPINPQRPYAPNALSFISPEHGFMTSIYITRETKDGGETWTEKEETLFESWPRSLFMVTENVGYAYGNKEDTFEDLYRTRDGGQTWEATGVRMDPNLPDPLRINPVFRTSNFGYFAFEFADFFDFGMYKTSNQGETWSAYGSLPFFEGQQKGAFQRCAPTLDKRFMYCIERDREVIMKVKLN